MTASLSSGEIPARRHGEPYRPVKGAGVGVDISELFGERLGKRAFSGAGRPVYGDIDHFVVSFPLNPFWMAAASAAAIAVENAI